MTLKQLRVFVAIAERQLLVARRLVAFRRAHPGLPYA